MTMRYHAVPFDGEPPKVQVINEEIRMAFGHPVNWPAEDVRLRQ